MYISHTFFTTPLAPFEIAPSPFESRALTRADLRSLIAAEDIDILRLEQMEIATGLLEALSGCATSLDKTLNMN